SLSSQSPGITSSARPVSVLDSSQARRGSPVPRRACSSSIFHTSEVAMATCVCSDNQEIQAAEIAHNVAPARLYELGVTHEGATIAASGALATFSGEKTGRSPKDKRIVENPKSASDVWWGSVNIPASEESFLKCREQALNFING